MVAAICITGIFIYFFFWSMKVKKEQDLEWLQIGKVEEAEVIEGMLTHYLKQKKRFNDRYWYLEIEGTLYLPEEHRSIHFTWKKPYTPQVNQQEFSKNQRICLYGRRSLQQFWANRIESLE